MAKRHNQGSRKPRASAAKKPTAVSGKGIAKRKAGVTSTKLALAGRSSLFGAAKTVVPAADGTVNNLDKIEHIIVLMMENRSFDHVLGYLTLENGSKAQKGTASGSREDHVLDSGRSSGSFRSITAKILTRGSSVDERQWPTFRGKLATLVSFDSLRCRSTDTKRPTLNKVRKRRTPMGRVIAKLAREKGLSI